MEIGSARTRRLQSSRFSASVPARGRKPDRRRAGIVRLGSGDAPSRGNQVIPKATGSSSRCRAAASSATRERPALVAEDLRNGFISKRA
jgi:hypothetical protein